MSATAPAAARPGPTRALAVPIVLATLLAVALGAFSGGFLVDEGPFVLALVMGWAVYCIGRGLLHWDVPRGGGAALQRVSAGAAGGIALVGFLNALLESGPGWPMTPWWALALGVSVGVYRAHRPLLQVARERPAQGRLWGLFDRRELQALLVLVAGYALAGFAAHRLFSAFSAFIPSAGQALTLGLVAYALNGARLLLAFASHDEAAPGGGFLAWFKANLLRNALVVVVLVAYGMYRDDLARGVPFFPLVEFGLGVAVFAFVLARLRAHLGKGATGASTTSEARDHRQKVETLSEPEYEAVAGAVSRFVETGRGQREYVETLRATAGLDEREAEALLAPARTHAEPPAEPVVPYGAAVAAYLLGAGFACAAIFALFVVMFDASPADAVLAPLFAAGLAVYGMQAEARRRARPWPALASAGAGVAILLGTFLFGVLDPGDAATLGGTAWSVVLLLVGGLLGVPGYKSWRLDADLRRGAYAPPPRARPEVELEQTLRRDRRRIGVTAGVALGTLLVVPPLARWQARFPFGMQGFPDFWADLMAVAFWAYLAVAGPALVRFVAASRARPAILAEQRRRRSVRLALHQDLMSTLERT